MGTTRSGQRAEIEAGNAAAVSFARLFITNPDLPARMAAGAVAPFESRALYTQGPDGYTDYPPLGT